MKKKLNKEAGFTLVEMLAATMVLILLAMMLGTGLQMTVLSYQKITAQSEVELMLSTAMNALADDLRFARNFDRGTYNIDTDDVPFTYKSDSFGGKIHLELDTGTGQIMAVDTTTTPAAPGKQFLSLGVYGVGKDNEPRAYQVTKMTIKPDTDKNTFTISLEVKATADESIKASGEITVHCLNDL